MSLYLSLELITLSVPLALSFDKNVQFWKHWKYLLPAIFLTSIIFIAIDIIFTSQGIWGFNPRYHSSVMIAGLPLEEILFFLIIPYSSIFIHYVIFAYYPKASLHPASTTVITVILLTGLALLMVVFHDRLYTFFYSMFLAVTLIIAYLYDQALLSKLYVSILVILIPFLLVNGLLTGSLIDEEVVWYNIGEISGFYVFTIPAEDFIYCLAMITVNLMFAGIIRRAIIK
jgi:lycopene cyclase domain-containing protein